MTKVEYFCPHCSYTTRIEIVKEKPHATPKCASCHINMMKCK